MESNNAQTPDPQWLEVDEVDRFREKAESMSGIEDLRIEPGHDRFFCRIEVKLRIFANGWGQPNRLGLLGMCREPVDLAYGAQINSYTCYTCAQIKYPIRSPQEAVFHWRSLTP